MSSRPTQVLLATICLALCLPGIAEAAKKRKPYPHVVRQQAARPAGVAAGHRRAATPPLVVFGDKVIGTDPDPRIRHELLRDLGAVFGGTD